ncbi:MAG: RNase adapter RapZ [Pseudomonadales bacterium]
MKLIIISGRSGSGKSTALHVLEDFGFNCVDNLPVGLLPSLVQSVRNETGGDAQQIAVGIDARNVRKDFERFPSILESLDRETLKREVVFLDASNDALVKRFSETRRRHPLTDASTGLGEALRRETRVLAPIADLADLTLDTSHSSPQELRDLVKSRIVGRTGTGLSLLFRSFAFKHGVPVDADFVFDLRCLPNPYWVINLRPFTGQDAQVVKYLSEQPDVQQIQTDILKFLETWLPRFEASNRSYMTVALGCTGGQHRSVYLADRLGTHFSSRMRNVLVRHRELGANE